MNKEDSLVPQGSQDLDRMTHEAKLAAARGAVELLLRGGQVFLDIHRQKQESTRADEEVRRNIQLLNAETQAELLKLQQELGKGQQETERLKILLDFYTANRGQLDEDFMALIRTAVTEITKHT